MAVESRSYVLKKGLGEYASNAIASVVNEFDFEFREQYLCKTELLPVKAELKEEVNRINERITLESWMFLFSIRQTSVPKLFFQ